MKALFALLTFLVVTSATPIKAAEPTASPGDYFGTGATGGGRAAATPQSKTDAASPVSSDKDPIIGSWSWLENRRVVFKADGTCGETGSWEYVSGDGPGRRYRVFWKNEQLVDVAVLSLDGAILSVRTNSDVTFDAHRVPDAGVNPSSGTGPSVASPGGRPLTSPTPAPDPLVGSWRWKMGRWPPTKIDILADGTVSDFKTGSKGRWTAMPGRGEKSYMIIWDGGSDDNAITLSPDRKKLTGKNRKGQHITADRIVP